MNREQFWINHHEKLANKNLATHLHNGFIFKKGTEAHRNFLRSLIINSNPSTILDIGCGSGDVTGPLSKYFDIVGIDPVKRSCELAKNKGLSIINQNYRDASIAKRFDTILCCEMLTLIDDKDDLIKFCYDNLKKTGKLIISVVNGGSILRRIFSLLDKKNNKFSVDVFDKENLTDLLIAEGFLIDSINLFFQSPFGGYGKPTLHKRKIGFLLANNLIITASKTPKKNI